eukprot:scaffold2347_cov173-Amphora_coffeaeformis.AAC.6
MAARWILNESSQQLRTISIQIHSGRGQRRYQRTPCSPHQIITQGQDNHHGVMSIVGERRIHRSVSHRSTGRRKSRTAVAVICVPQGLLRGGGTESTTRGSIRNGSRRVARTGTVGAT